MPSVSSHSSSVTVHPHARGADAGRRRLVPALVGSSPRPWGRCREALREMRHCRFIPTPVGQMAALAGCSVTNSVHPHARGADVTVSLVSSRNSGSSPRPWGRCHVRVNLALLDRFIPTPVGQIWSASPSAVPASVHPHARGADEISLEVGRGGDGSSPRPWGRWFAARQARGRAWFIPTPVGQIPSLGGRSSGPPGSSPRPWGR